MKVLIFLFLLILTNCTKPKTVLICGDHVCINKAEAEQYFEENLTIEVKVINNKKTKVVDLVELNMKNSSQGEREVQLTSKKDTKKTLKTLSNEEVKTIKKKLKTKKNDKKIVRKIDKTKKKNKNEIIKEKNTSTKKDNNILNNKIKRNIEVVDVCTILKKCSIDEISKYLIKQGKSKNFPDITKRQ